MSSAARNNVSPAQLPHPISQDGPMRSSRMRSALSGYKIAPCPSSSAIQRDTATCFPFCKRFLLRRFTLRRSSLLCFPSSRTPTTFNAAGSKVLTRHLTTDTSDCASRTFPSPSQAMQTTDVPRSGAICTDRWLLNSTSCAQVVWSSVSHDFRHDTIAAAALGLTDMSLLAHCATGCAATACGGGGYAVDESMDPNCKAIDTIAVCLGRGDPHRPLHEIKCFFMARKDDCTYRASRPQAGS